MDKMRAEFQGKKGRDEKRKRWKNILFILAAALMLAGCEHPEHAEEKKKYPVIRIAFSTNTQKPKDLARVNEALSEITEKKAGCDVELAWMDQGMDNDYRYFKGEEAVDITELYYTQYFDFQEKRFLLELDPYLAVDGKQMLEVMGKEADEFAGKDGHIYGIPKPMQDINSNGLMFCGKYLEKYDLSVDDIESFEDVEPLLALIREKEPQVTPFVRNVSGGNLIQRDPIGDCVDGLLSIVSFEDESLRAQNLYETEEYEQRIMLAKRWYEKGYLGESPTSGSEVGEDMVYSGEAFATEFVIRPDEVDYAKNRYGDAVKIIELDSKPKRTTEGDWKYVWAVSAHCKYPREAVKVLNLLYADADVVNLILYGIEGMHYVENEDGTIRYPDGINQSTVGYFNNNKWLYNRKIAKLWEGMDPDVMEQLEAFNQSAVISPAYGFMFDDSQVDFSLEPLQEVIDSYRVRLSMGMFDSKKELEEFQQKLRDAGSEKLLQEVQRQLDEWKSSDRQS